MDYSKHKATFLVSYFLNSNISLEFNLTVNDRSILRYIADCLEMNQSKLNKQSFMIKHTQIAKFSGCSRRTVQRSLNKLRDLDMINILPNAGNEANSYKIGSLINQYVDNLCITKKDSVSKVSNRGGQCVTVTRQYNNNIFNNINNNCYTIESILYEKDSKSVDNFYGDEDKNEINIADEFILNNFNNKKEKDEGKILSDQKNIKQSDIQGIENDDEDISDDEKLNKKRMPKYIKNQIDNLRRNYGIRQKVYSIPINRNYS